MRENKGEGFMAYTYSVPDFSIYKPKRLNNLAKKLDSIENAEVVVTEDGFQKSLNKLKENKPLIRRDYKALLYRLEELESSGLMTDFITKTQEYFQSHSRIYYHLKALIFSYYSLYRYRIIFNLLKLGFSVNQQWRDEIIPLKNLIEQSKDSMELFNNINKEFYNCVTLEEVAEKINLYMMKEDSSMVKAILTNKVLTEIEKGELNLRSEELRQITEHYLPQKNQKTVFEKFLLTQDDKNLENMHPNIEAWFRYIGECIGDPYGAGRAKWKGIDEEAIRIFQRWRAAKQIGVFFTEIIGDPRRLIFWKKYIKHFYRVEYFEEYEKALLMETKNHIFVEFAGIGAMYMYDREVLSIDKVEQVAEEYKRRYRRSSAKSYVISQLLKVEQKAQSRMIHGSDWEHKFQREFEYFNYHIGD